MIDATQAADIRARHDAVAAWLKSKKRNSYKPEELAAEGLSNPSNEELVALELFEFKRDKPSPYLVYIKCPEQPVPAGPRPYAARLERWRGLYSRTGSATTWTGDNLGAVQFGRAWQDNFGGVRIPISVRAITGDDYHGTYFASAGDYARIKKCVAR
jgi:hypothetical protein